jgi:hypothetical protein
VLKWPFVELPFGFGSEFCIPLVVFINDKDRFAVAAGVFELVVVKQAELFSFFLGSDRLFEPIDGKM